MEDNNHQFYSEYKSFEELPEEKFTNEDNLIEELINIEEPNVIKFNMNLSLALFFKNYGNDEKIDSQEMWIETNMLFNLYKKVANADFVIEECKTAALISINEWIFYHLMNKQRHFLTCK